VQDVFGVVGVVARQLPLTQLSATSHSLVLVQASEPGPEPEPGDDALSGALVVVALVGGLVVMQPAPRSKARQSKVRIGSTLPRVGIGHNRGGG
jgi:hypothetical protein